MSEPRMVKCVKLGREAEGLDRQPFKNELGKRLYENVSKDAWRMWIEHSKKLVNEYRAEKASEALHEQIRHHAVVVRSGEPTAVEVTDLVIGDVVTLQLGEVVPADLRLLAAEGLECDESTLTGESAPVEKALAAVPAATALAELSSCALMGTVVRGGSGRGVVVATAGGTVFGQIALGLGERQPPTEFQRGLAKFSVLLAQVAGVLTSAVFAVNT